MKLRNKIVRHSKRKKGIRKKVFGTPERYRLSVFRSLSHIYAQIIDDTKGISLVAACSKDKEVLEHLVAGTGKVGMSKAVGKILADRAVKANITSIVFDRNGFIYHGRVKALADAAREAGLKF